MPIINFSDEEILNIPDDLFQQTLAYRYYGNKILFVRKIKDLTIRQKMLREIVHL